MYSEQIEELIKSIIADGVITKKERSVLHKRAAAEGIDEDEIDVYIEGLIAQTKSETSQSVISKSANVDLNFVTKLNGRNNAIYYHTNNYFYVRTPLNGLIEKIHLYFFKQIENKEFRFGISFAFICRKKNDLTGNPILQLKSDTINNSIQLKHDYEIEDILSLKQSNQEISVYSYFFDEKMLKLLCDAKYITISMTDFRIYQGRSQIRREVYLKDISVDGLSIYAKVFYRSIVDRNAYPDALISKTDIQEDYLDNTKAIKILYADLKQLKMASSDVSYYKQYIETKTKTVHSFINYGKLFVNKRLKVKGKEEKDNSFSLGLHALTEKDGLVTYFFELISKYRGVGINYGVLKVSLVLGDYELFPIEIDEEVVTVKKKKHCFYMIDSNLLKQIAESKKFNLYWIGERQEISFKNGGVGLKSSLSFSNNWKKAIELLENRDQETSSIEPVLENDILSRINNLFGHLKYGM